MNGMNFNSLKLQAVIERWPLITPFRITGRTWHALDAIVVSLEKDGYVGRGEGEGVYYRQDTPELALKEIESLKTTIEAGISRESLRRLLPAGAARNALDCALWDLEAKCTGRPAWSQAGLEKPKPLLTTITCGADTPERMTAMALSYAHARAIKLKLTGEPVDAERVRAVRQARPDVWLGVDANQGFTRASLEQLMRVLVDTRVALIEQPFPIGQDAWLDGFNSPIAIAADESVQDLADIPGLAGRYQVMNIKLDKCGGLTGALAMARAADELGLEAMVGSMMGTSLAMAPAFLVGQLCHVVDLDGPVPLQADRAITVDYTDGFISCPEQLWGHADEVRSAHIP
jgi:L-Ala-D/L-Glu epimerase / N-acetyl-D-glutamate racemase